MEMIFHTKAQACKKRLQKSKAATYFFAALLFFASLREIISTFKNENPAFQRDPIVTNKQSRPSLIPWSGT
jgi:hypothetical protein